MIRSACRRPVDLADDRWAAIWAHHDELLAMARRRVVNASDAEDVVHEAMALAAADSHVELIRVGAWLNRVVRNRCADLARERSYADKCFVYEHGRARVQPLTEDTVCDRAEAAFLAQMLHTLPSRQHAALVHASEGLSNAQIATAMSTTVKAIESLLVKARRALRTAAAAVVFGFAYLCRRPTRSAPTAAGLVALSVGLSVYALHPASPSLSQPSRFDHARIEAQVIAHQPVTRTHSARASGAHVRRSVVQDSASPPHIGKPPGRSLHAKVGPSDTKVKTKQYGPVLNPVPDTVDCVRGGVIVSTSYIGCRISPGRN